MPKQPPIDAFYVRIYIRRLSGFIIAIGYRTEDALVPSNCITLSINKELRKLKIYFKYWDYLCVVAILYSQRTVPTNNKCSHSNILCNETLKFTANKYLNQLFYREKLQISRDSTKA